MTTGDELITVDLSAVDQFDRPAVMRECYLTLLNVGGEDGDWWEITSEIASGRDWREVLSDYFTFPSPVSAEDTFRSEHAGHALCAMPYSTPDGRDARMLECQACGAYIIQERAARASR